MNQFMNGIAPMKLVQTLSSVPSCQALYLVLFHINYLDQFIFLLAISHSKVVVQITIRKCQCSTQTSFYAQIAPKLLPKLSSRTSTLFWTDALNFIPNLVRDLLTTDNPAYRQSILSQMIQYIQFRPFSHLIEPQT